MIVVMIVVDIEAWYTVRGPGSKNQNKVPMTETRKCKRKTDRGRSAVCDDRGEDVWAIYLIFFKKNFSTKNLQDTPQCVILST